MTRPRRIAAPLLAAALAMLPWAARAASCTVTTTGVAFGNYDPSDASATTSTGQVTVSCNKDPDGAAVSYTIALSAGSGSFGNRTLNYGNSTLNYQLYTDASHSTVWGDGSGTATVGGICAFDADFTTCSTSHTVYGRIPAGQWPHAGNYSDAITVTVTY